MRALRGDIFDRVLIEEKKLDRSQVRNVNFKGAGDGSGFSIELNVRHFSRRRGHEAETGRGNLANFCRLDFEALEKPQTNPVLEGHDFDESIWLADHRGLACPIARECLCSLCPK